MKTSLRLVGLATLGLATVAIAGCASAAASDGSTVLNDIYTAAALTVESQSEAATPTATPAATSTSPPTEVPVGSPTASATTATSSYAYVYGGGCDNAAYVSDVTIEDGTELAPGETFTKTWELQNTGSCTWNKKYYVYFVSGNSMDGASTEIDQSVGPGDSAEISVSLTAPEDEGTYTGYWMLANSSGTAFGEKVYVQITVSEDVATSTPTPTASATRTASPAATAPTTSTIDPTSTIASSSTVSVTSTSEIQRHRASRTPTPTPEVPVTDAPGG